MAVPTVVIERYMGGGKSYWTPWDGTAYGAEVEIGEIKNVSLKLSSTTADATSMDSGIAKKVDKVVTAIDGVTSFTTQNMNKENMAMAMLGELSTETFAIGDDLPDGTVATVETIIPVIIGGVVPKIEGKLRVVSVNVAGTTNPVLEIPMLSLTPSGDIREYFADKHATLGFDGEIIETDGVFFKEYHMAKA